MILKTIIKSLWSSAFWYVKVCIFWKLFQYRVTNKYSSTGHHEQKNKKTSGQIKFSGGHNKIKNKTGLSDIFYVNKY